MSQEEVRRMWVGGQIDEPIHTAMMKTATRIGIHPSVLVERCIEEFIKNYVQHSLEMGEEVDDKLLVTALALENRERENQIAQLKSMAYFHLRYSTEESAEQLESACRASGIPVETLMKEINSNQHIKELVTENGSLSNAELWLLENLMPDKEYPMSEIISRAKEHGFKDWAIKNAKRNLRIESKRREKMWIWVLKSESMEEKPSSGDEIVF
jgi:hypothetical protein